MTTKAECIAAAGRALAEGIARRDSLTPREAALEAYVPGDELSVDELEALIRRQRDDNATPLAS